MDVLDVLDAGVSSDNAERQTVLMVLTILVALSVVAIATATAALGWAGLVLFLLGGVMAVVR